MSMENPSFSNQPADEERWRMRQLMGLNIKYEKLTEEELSVLLGSDQRISAYENILADTLPFQARAEQKRGIVSEMLRKDLIDQDTFQQFPTVYIGSGLDVEYPLALGARDITMVDMLYSDERNIKLFKNHLAKYGELTEQSEHSFVLSFDFGSGQEQVSVKVDPRVYRPEDIHMNNDIEQFKMPEYVGLLITFAPNSPYGLTTIADEDLRNIVPEGGYINDSEFIRTDPNTGEKVVKQIGEVEDFPVSDENRSEEQKSDG